MWVKMCRKRLPSTQCAQHLLSLPSCLPSGSWPGDRRPDHNLREGTSCRFHHAVDESGWEYTAPINKYCFLSTCICETYRYIDSIREYMEDWSRKVSSYFDFYVHSNISCLGNFIKLDDMFSIIANNIFYIKTTAQAF